MNKRISVSIFLVLSSIIIVVFPGVGKYSFAGDPALLADEVFSEDLFIGVDKVAEYVINEDSTVQFIDLRPYDEFLKYSIPGSYNVPIEDFFKRKPESFLYNKDINYILYSNSDIKASTALTFAQGLGYKNTLVMNGGLNEWFEIVMNSTYTGLTLTPRQNRIFETRTKARRFFTEINSLPDSLKLKYAESRRQAENDLDGGCE